MQHGEVDAGNKPQAHGRTSVVQAGLASVHPYTTVHRKDAWH